MQHQHVRLTEQNERRGRKIIRKKVENLDLILTGMESKGSAQGKGERKGKVYPCSKKGYHSYLGFL